MKQLLVRVTWYIFRAVHSSKHHVGTVLQLQQARDLQKEEMLLLNMKLHFNCICTSKSHLLQGAHPVLCLYHSNTPVSIAQSQSH